MNSDNNIFFSQEVRTIFETKYHFYNVVFFYRCGLPVCDEVCEKGHLHASYECPIFAKAFDNNEATKNPDCGIFTCCGDYSSGAKKSDEVDP